MLDLATLTTETRNVDTMDLDRMTPEEFVRVMNREDHKVAEAVEKVLPQIAQTITWAVEALKKGGRIIYVGAGTSGRLGILDAAECPPTFGVSSDMVVGVIAGGTEALTKAVEKAEDSNRLCEEDLKKIRLSEKDLVIGLATSGRTPYVVYGLRYAGQMGCRTVGISCNADAWISEEAGLAIEVVTGPEVLTGSTRLKAGTAQKMILNMISTGSMAGIGKVYQNLMVDVQQSNEKLMIRARNITMEATGCTAEEAERVLKAAGGYVKKAILMILLECDSREADKALEKADGHIRKALESV
ncbi:MAG: N-acetylmuramic acid 6-phosphate etherase [Lachnospiraceae bacterium]|jgi:N-acetylmuramic acid 6-phosphate etherase|nr:N-acetylmuramic acid 6-phosphate etherase [Lachnospiraceae bacterium]